MFFELYGIIQFKNKIHIDVQKKTGASGFLRSLKSVLNTSSDWHIRLVGFIYINPPSLSETFVYKYVYFKIF